MQVAIFDLDRTLVDCNSGRLWLTEEWRAGRVGVRDALWATFYLVRYSLGHGEMEHVLEQAVASLGGVEEMVIAERTREWFDRCVACRLRPGARDAIARHREAGDRLVLATSSSVYAAAAALEHFGLDDAIAMDFEVEDGLFTGRVRSLAFGVHKATRVARWAEEEGIDLSRSTFYTDSATDLPLLEAVGHPVIVNPDRLLARVAAERGWEVVDWGVSG